MQYWEPEGHHKLGEGHQEANAVFKRLKEATGTNNIKELANWLGARQAWISDARKKNIMPVRWLQMLVLKYSNYSPRWVITGEGEKFWSGGVYTPAGLRALQLGYYMIPDPDGESTEQTPAHT